MLRVSWKPSSLSRAAFGNNSQSFVSSDIPKLELDELMCFFKISDFSNFPMFVKVEEVSALAKIDFLVIKHTLSNEERKEVKKVAPADCTVANICCFLRFLENTFLETRQEQLHYVRGMSYEGAMAERKRALGPDASVSFCWDVQEYGSLPKEVGLLLESDYVLCAFANIKTSNFHSLQSFQSVSNDDARFGDDVSISSNLTPVRTDTVSVNVSGKIAANETNVSVSTINRPRISSAVLKQRFRISPTVLISDELLEEIEEKEKMRVGEFMVCDPQVFLTLKIASIHGDMGYVAIDWYSRNFNDGLPVNKVSAEIEQFVRELPAERLKFLYLYASPKVNKQLPWNLKCLLCYDVGSHFTHLCVRYQTYRARLQRQGMSCHGCGRPECIFGNSNHTEQSSIVFCVCGKYEHERKHVKWLCNDTSTWMKWRIEFLKISYLAVATRSWTLEELELCFRTAQKLGIQMSATIAAPPAGARI